MRPLTDRCPKPLLKVAGKPLIEHHIERLAKAGYRNIVINVSYLGEQIKDYLGAGSRWGVSIIYSFEDAPLETGGGIFNALPYLGESESFLVVNADVWCDIDLAELALKEGDLGMLVLVNNPIHNPQGDFYLAGDRALAKPINAANVPDLIDKTDTMTFSGISLLHPDLFEGQVSGKFSLAPLLRTAMEEARVGGVSFSGYWLDVGTPERLQELDDHLTASC